MTNEKQRVILDRIKSHISKHGYHVTVVDGAPAPRFGYTIGLHEKFGFELAFAGASFFDLDDTLDVLKAFVDRFRSGGNSTSPPMKLEGLGSFSLQEIESSWAQKILLGALDYYHLEDIEAFQVTPDREHWTIDIPNMKDHWDPALQPIWRWLEATWDFPVSATSKAITNLDALRGHAITEVVRWEESEWEMFAGAGPDVEQSDIRVVPLGTMLGHDPTLECTVSLKIGEGLWRDGGGLPWHSWAKRESKGGEE